MTRPLYTKSFAITVSGLIVSISLTFVATLNTAVATEQLQTGVELPNPGMKVEKGHTALVITDPQNDFLSPKGMAWGVLGKSVTADNTVENIETLSKSAKANDVPVFISPHYYYPHDHGWRFQRSLEKLMHSIGMFDRQDALSTNGFEDSGADWLERHKSYIKDGKTVLTSPHKVYGPETNDMICNCESVR